MPALELRVSASLPASSSTRLRSVLEKPNAVVLRRNHLAQALEGDDSTLHNRLRITAILAVDITNPPRAASSESTSHSADDVEGEDVVENDEFVDSFAKGVEIFIGSERQSALVLADFDELAAAVSLFDSYERIARYQPAYLRLDQRSIGISYAFREGLVLGIAADPKQFRENLEGVFDTVSALSEVEDSRASRFTVRLPNSGIVYMHELLLSASEWLNQNSYKNILGS